MILEAEKIVYRSDTKSRIRRELYVSPTHADVHFGFLCLIPYYINLFLRSSRFPHVKTFLHAIPAGRRNGCYSLNMWRYLKTIFTSVIVLADVIIGLKETQLRCECVSDTSTGCFFSFLKVHH